MFNGFVIATLASTLLICAGSSQAMAQPTAQFALETWTKTDIYHGGGCRKSSPKGQCCHMDRKAGKVHCH